MSLLDDRQKRTGWLLIIISALYLVWFIKVRLFADGLPIEKREWVYFVGMSICLMLGTANVRMAAMRAEKRKLEEGMVINIEPLITDSVGETYHLEDLFVVTANGPRLLTMGFAPKQIPVIGQSVSP